MGAKLKGCKEEIDTGSHQEEKENFFLMPDIVQSILDIRKNIFPVNRFFS